LDISGAGLDSGSHLERPEGFARRKEIAESVIAMQFLVMYLEHKRRAFLSNWKGIFSVILSLKLLHFHQL